MHITAIMVISVNGRITNADNPDPRSWSSAEDSAQFKEFVASKKVLIMGSGTYEAPQSTKKATFKHLRIVLTGDPAKYWAVAVPDQLEFYKMPPAEVVKMLEDRGFKEAVLLGGAATNRDFFAAGLVNELHLTIEPKLFGSGRPLIEEGEFTANLKLLESRQLNDLGTLLLRYAVN